MSSPTPPAQPARYQRSAGGMVGALVVLLLVIGAFVAFRAVTRTQPEVRPEPIAYLQTVRLAQSAGRTVVYPRQLPAGWIATRADAGSPGDVSWSLTMLTDDDQFAGIRQEGGDLDPLLATYVDEDAEEGQTVGVASALAPRWREFSDAGGDTAYAAEVGDDWVLVYGSAPADDLLAIVGALTDEPLS
ncbi:MAG: DUF4245 family protein [Nocardioides sp.]